MNSAPSAVKNPDLMVIMMLARLLEKLDQSPVAADPGQYRSVVLSLSRVLLQASSNPALEPLLRAHPSAAQLYENLHYQHAGLLRSPLSLSLSTEAAARELLQRVADRVGQSPGA